MYKMLKKMNKICVKTQSYVFLICVFNLVTVVQTPNRRVVEKVDDQE